MPGWDESFAFERLQEHKSTIAGASGSNEATTRLRAINTMLFDVLGWDKLDVEAERYCRAEGFADYALKDESSICLIVEAKKSEETFVIPSRAFAVTAPVGFPLIAEECPAADRALRQALGYAASEGARFIAITNGFQWIITLTFVPNQNITERSVYVFESVDAIEKNFALFWNCFSQQGLLSNWAVNALLECRKAPPPSKLAQRLLNYPVPANRNQIADELGIVLGIVWDETRYEEDEPEFLAQCYVEPRTSAASIAQAKELLERKLSTDERIRSQAIETGGVAPLIPNYSPDKPVVVLGNVGHGKSTFLRYLRMIKAKEVLGKYVQLQIDFIDRPDSQSDVGRFVYGEVERQLREHYGIDSGADAIVRAALHPDLARFKRSPEGLAFPKDSPEYRREELDFIKDIKGNIHIFLQKVIYHIKFARSTSVAIFFDNLDRRSESIQEEAFLRASAIARDWASLVFVCLRPTTFYKSKTFGVLDSVAPVVINVVSPKTENLVVRRLKFAKKFAEGTPLSRKSQRAPLSANLSAHLPRVALTLDSVADSFRKNGMLAPFFDAISNGNARDVLTYVYDVLTSMHLDTTKILDKIETTGGYIMPEHEALKAILLGNFMHYNPEISVFINLYDIQKADPMEHFTRLLALHHAVNVPDTAPTFGYCGVADLIRYLCQIGFSEEHVRFTTKHLYKKKCYEARDPIEEWSETIKEVKVTPLGKYHINVLAHKFQYIDAVLVDTPIIYDNVRQILLDSFAIRERLERSRRFLEYLDACSMSLHDARARQTWSYVRNAAKAEIVNIESYVACH